MVKGLKVIQKEQFDHIRKITDAMSNAPSDPTPACEDGGEHEFKAISHADGRDSYVWLFECEKCGEFVRSERKRTGEDLAYWAD